MIIPADNNYRVQIKFTKFDFFSDVSMEQHWCEVNQLRVWLDELVEWQPEGYTMNIYSQGTQADVWFKEKEHAMLCTLRWA